MNWQKLLLFATVSACWAFNDAEYDYQHPTNHMLVTPYIDELQQNGFISLYGDDKKEKKKKKEKSKNCVICQKPKSGNSYCNGHHMAERNFRSNPSEKNKKLLAELEAYRQKKKDDKARENLYNCVICQTPTNNKNRSYCSGHHMAERNCGRNPSEKNKKLLAELEAYRQKKKDDKAAAVERGPTCKNKDCGETDPEKFSKHPRTQNGYHPLCNKCLTATYNLCHKHTEQYGKRCYKHRCIHCKLDDKIMQSLLCQDNAVCITQIHRPRGLSCGRCFRRKNPDHEYSRRYREKEDIFHAFLQSIPNIKIRRNFRVNVDLPSGTTARRYVDFRIETAHFIIDIEFDETQHTTINYKTTCELMRSDLIYEASLESNKKYMLLRFNPDGFTAQDGEKFRSCFTSKPGAKVDISDKAQWKLRTSYFKSKLEECMQLDPENEELFPYVEIMFYDGFDTSKLDAAVGGSSSGKKRKITERDAAVGGISSGKKRCKTNLF